MSMAKSKVSSSSPSAAMFSILVITAACLALAHASKPIVEFDGIVVQDKSHRTQGKLAVAGTDQTIRYHVPHDFNKGRYDFIPIFRDKDCQSNGEKWSCNAPSGTYTYAWAERQARENEPFAFSSKDIDLADFYHEGETGLRAYYCQQSTYGFVRGSYDCVARTKEALVLENVQGLKSRLYDAFRASENLKEEMGALVKSDQHEEKTHNAPKHDSSEASTSSGEAETTQGGDASGHGGDDSGSKGSEAETGSTPKSEPFSVVNVLQETYGKFEEVRKKKMKLDQLIQEQWSWLEAKEIVKLSVTESIEQIKGGSYDMLKYMLADYRFMAMNQISELQEEARRKKQDDEAQAGASSDGADNSENAKKKKKKKKKFGLWH